MNKVIENVRKIIHIDMDAFFASVEQRDNPEYKGKPIAVGGLGGRGVVATASYEARKYGVHSAMPSKTAIKKCPFLIFVKPRFEAYKHVSDQIRLIFHEYTDLVEPLSLDEAYLDVTHHKIGKPSATLIAKEIKQRIWEETKLTASAGISINKFLAKVASDYHKPNGLFLIKPEEAETFVANLPIEKFFGIGKVTAAKMHSMNISTGSDLKRFSEYELIKHFGKQGKYYYYICRAIDTRLVEPERVRKSVGAENTFSIDISDIQEMLHELEQIAKVLYERIQKSCFQGKTLTLKVKFHDFKQITRSKKLNIEISNYNILWISSLELFNKTILDGQKVRLFGLSVSNPPSELESNAPLQLTINF
jgi:DNA polymerase IV